MTPRQRYAWVVITTVCATAGALGIATAIFAITMLADGRDSGWVILPLALIPLAFGLAMFFLLRRNRG
jgi:hypothetical protein